MQLGFVSAILPDLALEEVLAFAGATGYDCVEVMCWPKGAADRRYAGVTHIDVNSLDDSASALASTGVHRRRHQRARLLSESSYSR